MNIIVPHSDRLIQAHRYFTGAKDTAILNELVRYSRGQGLLSNLRLYPMKSRQNYGSGATVAGIGSLTANNMTLINGPTWGAGGLAFVAASSQYGNAGDIVSGGHLTVFTRVSLASATPVAVMMLAAQDNGGVSRGWYYAVLTNGALRLLRSPDGSGIEAYDSAAGIASTSNQTLVAKWTEGGGRSLWQDKTSRALTLFSGTARTSLVNSSLDVFSGANLVSNALAAYIDGTVTAQMYINGSDLTTPQRETLTDLINAL